MNKKSDIFVEIAGYLLVLVAFALIAISLAEGLYANSVAKAREQHYDMVKLAALKAASCLRDDRVQAKIDLLDASAKAEQEEEEAPTRRPEVVDRMSQVNDQVVEAEVFMRQKWTSVYAQRVGPAAGPRLAERHDKPCCGSVSRWDQAIRRWGRVE